MGDLSDQAVLERLHARRGVLDNKQLTQVMDLLEGYTRRNHGDVCDQARHLRELEKETREVRETARTLTGRWDRVWDSVRFAFLLSRAQLRRELVREHERSCSLATIVVHSLSAIVQLDARLDALEAAAESKAHT